MTSRLTSRSTRVTRATTSSTMTTLRSARGRTSPWRSSSLRRMAPVVRPVRAARTRLPQPRQRHACAHATTSTNTTRRSSCLLNPRSARLRSPPPHHATHLLDDRAIKLNLRLTANLQAKQGSRNSTFYSQYVTTTVQEHAGNNQGYSRYLDNHIGVDIANLMTLGKSGRHSCHAHSCHAQPSRDVRNDCVRWHARLPSQRNLQRN